MCSSDLGDGQESLGDGEQHVHDAHDGIVKPAAVVAGDGAQKAPHDQCDAHGHETDLQGHSGAVDQAAQDVPAELVRAQPVRGARRLE